MSDKHNIQTFDVDAIRDRILPDASSTPAERMRRLCQYIEEDYPGWRARHMPDMELSAAFAKILLTRELARIELIFEVTATQSPLVVKTTASFLEYELEVPPLPKKCLHDRAIEHSRDFLVNWLQTHVNAIKG